MSGFCSTRPPLEEKLPGVIAAPVSAKKIRRGPSELNVSTLFAAVKGAEHGPVDPKPPHAGEAATPNVLAALVAA
jgi:hypothetical protein